MPPAPSAATISNAPNLDPAINDTRMPDYMHFFEAFGAAVIGGPMSRDSGVGTRDSGLGTRDSGLGTRDAGRGTRDAGFGTRDSGFGTRDSGFGIRDGR